LWQPAQPKTNPKTSQSTNFSKQNKPREVDENKQPPINNNQTKTQQNHHPNYTKRT
jgi:hypothetical protein